MKKIFISCGCILAVCIAAFSLVKVNQNNDLQSLLLKCDIEALTSCEITNSKGEVLFSCSGDGKCSEKYLGKTLTCDGTKN